MQRLPLVALKDWFLSSKRDLPWRKNPSPYHVWISEVMLQQTQVGVVCGYFQRWMDRFPTIPSLAKASVEEVVKLWEGLGYYCRARNLHRAAKHIVELHGGDLPSSRDALEQIPGLGPYTVGAILSFAFQTKAAAVDGNVTRVLARFTGLEENTCSSKVKKWIWNYAESILPDEEPWLVVEGLIELGATICTRRPKCFMCPLSSECIGLKKGIADLLPIKSKKAPPTNLTRQVAIVKCGEFYLLSKGKQGRLMADLYEFPYFEGEDRGSVTAFLMETFNLSVLFLKELPFVQHTFTRYRATLYPSIWETLDRPEINHYDWIREGDLKSLPFSAGHRKIIHSLSNSDAHITY